MSRVSTGPNQRGYLSLPVSHNPTPTPARPLDSSFSIQFHEDLACKGRKEEFREECRATLTQALAPTKLSCMSSFHSLFVCQNPVEGHHTKRGCSKEDQQLSECLQVHACDAMLRSVCDSCARDVAAVEYCRMCLVVACRIIFYFASMIRMECLEPR